MLGNILLEGLYPLFIHSLIAVLPPLFFAGASSCIAACVLAGYLFWSGAFRSSIPLKAYGYVIGVVLTIVVIAQIMVFVGTQYTTPVNIGLLLRFELVTSFVVGHLILRDRLHMMEMVGAMLICVGTCSVLYNGSFDLNPGDLLIVLATFLFPIGNCCAKKALQYMSSSMLLCLRYVLGGVLLLGMSALLEQPVYRIELNALILFLLFSFCILIGSKICFYESLKRVQFTHLMFVLVAGSTIVTVIASYVLLGEVPTFYQWIGVVCTMFGMYLLTHKTQLPSEGVHDV